MKIEKKKMTGAVLVEGGGIAGVQASLDLANSGYKVYLVNRSATIGGMMSHLDKTFPTKYGYSYAAILAHLSPCSFY